MISFQNSSILARLSIHKLINSLAKVGSHISELATMSETLNTILDGIIIETDIGSGGDVA